MRMNLNHYNDLNARVYKLKDISMSGAYYLQEGLTINVQRHGCNKYGNPLYHLYMETTYMDKIKSTKGRFGRVLTDKASGLQYLTFTSYNIGSDLTYLFKKCGILN